MMGDTQTQQWKAACVKLNWLAFFRTNASWCWLFNKPVPGKTDKNFNKLIQYFKDISASNTTGLQDKCDNLISFEVLVVR